MPPAFAPIATRCNMSCAKPNASSPRAGFNASRLRAALREVQAALRRRQDSGRDIERGKQQALAAARERAIARAQAAERDPSLPLQ